MKNKGKYIIGGAAIASAALFLRRKKDVHDMRQKYNFLDEIPDKDLSKLPLFLCNPIGFRLFNVFMTGGKGEFVKGIKRTTIQIQSFDNEMIELYLYEPEGTENETLPCLLYLHGGGFYGDYLPAYHKIAANYAKYANCRVISVRYRTLTKVKYESALKDCYQGFLWAYENAERIGIDKEHIAVGGDSAGGTFAAALTHYTREKKGPKFCYQMLVYPATDLSLSSESMRRFVDTPGWNAECDRSVFKYIKPQLNAELRPYLSLVEQKNFEDLCNAYVEVEEYDCLRDEGELYASILEEHGYDVYFNDMKRTFHGYDQDQELEVAKETMKLRCELLRKAFETE